MASAADAAGADDAAVTMRAAAFASDTMMPY